MDVTRLPIAAHLHNFSARSCPQRRRLRLRQIAPKKLHSYTTLESLYAVVFLCGRARRIASLTTLFGCEDYLFGAVRGDPLLGAGGTQITHVALFWRSVGSVGFFGSGGPLRHFFFDNAGSSSLLKRSDQAAQHRREAWKSGSDVDFSRGNLILT